MSEISILGNDVSDWRQFCELKASLKKKKDPFHEAFKIAPYGEPTHLAQKKDPWNRLYTTNTLSSARREVQHYDPQAPHDSLDFILKADYDHHNQLLEPKPRTLMQPETIGDDHGRVLKNRVKQEAVRSEEQRGPTMAKINIENPKKESINSVKGAIESHHSAATNGGYSRKHDGGFYTT